MCFDVVQPSLVLAHRDTHTWREAPPDEER